MKQKLLFLLVLLLTATTGAWATDGIACSASDIGKVLCTDGSIYATVGDATTAQKTAAAMIAYIDATNNKGLAIALADESGTKTYEAAGTACSGKAAVTGGTWRLPSDKDWQYMFIGCGSSGSYSTPTHAMEKSYSGLASKLTTAQGAALQYEFYWSSTLDDPNGAWGVVFDGSNATFYMEDKTADHKVRACLEFDVTSTYTVSLNDGTEDATNWQGKAGEGAYQELPLEGVAANTAVSVKYNGTKKVKSVKAVKKVDPKLATPLTIEAITAGKIQVVHPKAGMKYSLDGGTTKNAVTTDEIALNAGDKVQFYGNGTSITSYGSNVTNDCTMINRSGNGFTCKVYGNIMSLVDEENFATATTLSDKYTFKFLFYNNTKLTDASGLLLPATTLQESCYHSMFSKCTALTAAPALPATQLAAHCYNSMFNECTALTAAPVLPAKKLVMYCYYAMFNCCSKLATVTCLATSGINLDYSTSYWLNDAGSAVQGTKTVYTVNTANWPVDNYTVIPADWTCVNIDN